MISVHDVSMSYGRFQALSNITWKVEAGDFWGVIGPNGSGKSTLLSLISGVVKPRHGEILMNNQPLARYGRKQLAQKVAVLQQDGLPPIDYPVREVLEMGRFPFQDWRRRDLNEDAGQLLDEIMEKLELKQLADRPLSSLSGGQRQRVALGKVMAQQPEIVLLDEPTTYLDIRFQLQFMDFVSSWQQEAGLTIISVMHDLNLAALYCDHVLVLKEGRIKAMGRPEDILISDVIEEVYEVGTHSVPHPDTGVPQFMFKRSHSFSSDREIK